MNSSALGIQSQEALVFEKSQPREDITYKKKERIKSAHIQNFTTQIQNRVSNLRLNFDMVSESAAATQTEVVVENLDKGKSRNQRYATS